MASAGAKRPEDADFTRLTGGRRPCPIPLTEHRGICPFQLRLLLEFMAARTAAGAGWVTAAGDDDVLPGWRDERTGAKIRLREINLYQVMRWA